MNMKKHLLMTLVAMLPFLAVAQNVPVTANIVCGPYLQNVTTDSFTVMWITDMDAVGWVEIAPDNDEHFYYNERPKYYDMRGYGLKPIGKIHKVTVDGLKPGTNYRYRVMMTAVQDYINNFEPVYGNSSGAAAYKAKLPVARTLDENYDEVKFAVVNDIHAQDSLFRRLFTDKEKNKDFNFVVFNGDMTSELTYSDKVIRHYLKPASDLFANETPFFMVRGNHEFRGKEALRIAEYFDFPQHGPYYTFKYGKYFFLVMDSGEDKADSDIENKNRLCSDPYLDYEAAWLKGVVESDDWKNAEKRIVFCHIPPQIKGAWHGNLNLSQKFIPILNEAGVDLMISGHVHRYSFQEPGTTDAKFPVITNGQWQRLEVTENAKKISIRIYDTDGKLTHSVDL
jgi:acid phosphatase type 7